MTDKNKKIVDSFGNSGDIILNRLSGSRLYGTSFEKGEHPFNPDYVSDFDYRSVHVINPRHKLNLHNFNEFDNVYKSNKEDDFESYEIEKFFFELTRNNPNYMDIVFADNNSLVYSNDIGDYLLENKSLFLTSKLINKFEGFANLQMRRFNNVVSWIDNYNDIDRFLELLEKYYSNGTIDFHFIKDYFSPQLASYLSEESSHLKKASVNFNIFKNIMKFEEQFDITKYTLPKPIDYIKINNIKKTITSEKDIHSFLFENAKFEIKDNTILFIYNNGDGIFNHSGGFKRNLEMDSIKNDDDLLFLGNFNKYDFDERQKHLTNLWEWKIGREKSTELLAQKYGDDLKVRMKNYKLLKHGMHTYRLLETALSIFRNNDYKPEMNVENIKKSQDILAGVYSFQEINKMFINKKDELKRMKNEKKLRIPQDVDSKKISHLYNDIIEHYINKYKKE